MLTGDLLRARVRKGQLHPAFIDPDDGSLLALAEEVIALFADHVGSRRGELEEALSDWVGDTRDFQLLRGLARLVEDRATFGSPIEVDPVALRRSVFEAAAAVHPVRARRDALHAVTREDVLHGVAEAHGLSVAAVEEALYADLRSEERMVSIRPITAAELLARYNVALVQALLLRADGLAVTLPEGDAVELRRVLRWLKFRQLMFRARALPAGGWQLLIDGPMSLFQQTQRYGLQLALFFPALLPLDGWSIEASVSWGRRPQLRTLSLTPDPRLRPTGRATGTWVSREQQLLEERISEHRSPWQAERSATLIDLGGEDTLVPDLTVRCAQSGRVAWVEVLGFWRRAWLERRMETLARYGPPNLVLCVSRRMGAAREELGALGENVVEFAEVIPLGKLLARVEAVARVPET